MGAVRGVRRVGRGCMRGFVCHGALAVWWAVRAGVMAPRVQRAQRAEARGIVGADDEAAPAQEAAA